MPHTWLTRFSGGGICAICQDTSFPLDHSGFWSGHDDDQAKVDSHRDKGVVSPPIQRPCKTGKTDPDGANTALCVYLSKINSSSSICTRCLTFFLFFSNRTTFTQLEQLWQSEQIIPSVLDNIAKYHLWIFPCIHPIHLFLSLSVTRL